MGAFMTFMLTPSFRAMEATRGVLLLRIMGGVLGLLGAPAALIIWFGMMAFCLTEDSSSKSARAVWCLFFLVAAFFASAIYFFSVYRKQVQETITAGV